MPTADYEYPKMNGIQNYLMATAISTIRKASADIIKDGEIDPAMVVASMQELIAHLKKCESSLESAVECKISYCGIEPGKRPPKAGDPDAYPFFSKKANNS